MPKTGSKQQLGVRGEDLTCAELQRQGMQVLERNWRCRLGEPLQSLARDDTSDLPDQF
jgi:putative endonuclease